MPSVRALSWTARTAFTISVSEREEEIGEVRDGARLVDPPEEAEQREGEEDERHDRGEREVRHHRRQVCTADGEERPERCAEREPRHLRSITPQLDSVAELWTPRQRSPSSPELRPGGERRCSAGLGRGLARSARRRRAARPRGRRASRCCRRRSARRPRGRAWRSCCPQAASSSSATATASRRPPPCRSRPRASSCTTYAPACDGSRSLRRSDGGRKPMRRLIVLAPPAAAAWWLLTRRRPAEVRTLVGTRTGRPSRRPTARRSTSGSSPRRAPRCRHDRRARPPSSITRYSRETSFSGRGGAPTGISTSTASRPSRSSCAARRPARGGREEVEPGAVRLAGRLSVRSR